MEVLRWIQSNQIIHIHQRAKHVMLYDVCLMIIVFFVTMLYQILKERMAVIPFTNYCQNKWLCFESHMKQMLTLSTISLL